MGNPTDISGSELEEGTEVAFCLGGSGLAMKTGEVIEVLPKTVRIAYNHEEYQGRVEALTCLRPFSSVCKVWR